MALVRLLVLFLFALTSCGASAGEIIKFPRQIDKGCRDGRAKLYDECSDQVALFKSALTFADENGKVLLVSYGAEWCIWCHVFDAYIEGGKSKFRYTYGSPRAPDERYRATIYEREKEDVTEAAESLRRFVAESFVIVHVENYHSPNGYSVLEVSGADQHYDKYIPYVFSVDSQGAYAGHFVSERAKTRRDTDDWYRGYNRQQLTQELDRLKTLAQ